LDAEENWPRNLFIWRSNVLGSSGKGQEYFLRHLLGTENGILGGELDGSHKELMPLMEKWRPAPRGKLDLLVNMDFRMSTTSIYSDIVLPAATFYEKNDINTTDMHSFIRSLKPFNALGKAEAIGRHSKTSPRSSLKLPQNMRTTSETSLTLFSHRSDTTLRTNSAKRLASRTGTRANAT